MANISPVPTGMDQPGLAECWTEFGSVLDDIRSRLAVLPRDMTLDIESLSGTKIGDVTVADFAEKLSKIHWALSDSAYDNGGVGEVISVWENPAYAKGWIRGEEPINAESFLKYAAHPDQKGLYYLALHETAHVTDLGLQQWRSCWTRHCDNCQAMGVKPTSENYANTPEWTFNEAVANMIVRRIETVFAMAELDNPGGGYPTFMRPLPDTRLA